VEQLPDGADRQRTRVLLGLREASSLHFLGRFTEILELLLPQREVVDALGEPGLAGEFFVRLGRTYDVLGDHARAVESANRALEAARRCGDDAIAGKAEFVLAYVGYWSGRHRDGVAHGMRAVELLEKGDEHWWRGQAHWVVGVNQIVLAEYPAALASLERAGKIAGQIADRRLQSVVGWGTGAVHALAGDFATALVECTRAFEEAPDPLARAVAQGLLGGVYVEQGEPVAALPLLEESVRHLEHFRLRQTQGWYTTLLADAHLLAGNVDRARALATAGLETTVSVGFGFGMACAHRALARVETAAGAHAAAETHYRAAIAGFAAIGSRYEQARSHLELAELAVARHRAEIAREELDEARRLSADLPFDRYAARLTAVAAAIPSPPR
jgi:tetratricopeptide (TPR) repeat protein